MITTIDFAILDWVAAHLRCGFLDVVAPAVTFFGEGGWVWILLTLVLLLRKDSRKTGLALMLSLLLDLLLCNLLLKPLVARPRPFWVREDIALLVSAPKDFSFPSGHAAASFAAAGALFFQKSRLRVPALIFAGAIALSRIYLYVHYPSDVLVGTILGLFCGFMGSLWAKMLLQRRKNPQK